MSDILNNCILAVRNSQTAYCRYITANDVGKTGGHQSGFYVPKDSWKLLFDSPGIKGQNLDRLIRINWNDALDTDSRAVYYGKGTRNEYRITRFGKNFPFLDYEHSGSLMVLARLDTDEYKAYVLDSDEDIEGFVDTFDISPNSNRNLINVSDYQIESNLQLVINDIIRDTPEFPDTQTMAKMARDVWRHLNFPDSKKQDLNPDKAIVEWIDTEFKLFKSFEEREFETSVKRNITDCQNLIRYSNTFLNRRKARAGKSLEHHLATIFEMAELKFEKQVVTEGSKRPDFIFPDGTTYHNLLFPADGLTFLGAKTTCKDRWRQVLNEADRIPSKYLFTLQPGISANQLDEMKAEQLTLVVPKSNVNTFEASHRSQLLTLENFICLVKTKQNNIYTPWFKEAFENFAHNRYKD